MNQKADSNQLRRKLHRDALIFLILTVNFWLCSSFFRELESHPVGVWVVYAAALLFIAFGFLTIFRCVATRVERGQNHLVTLLGTILAFLFFSIGGPLVFSWLSLRSSNQIKA